MQRDSEAIEGDNAGMSIYLRLASAVQESVTSASFESLGLAEQSFLVPSHSSIAL